MQQEFKTWVLETLYTHQLGTTKQKTVVAAKLLGTTYDAVKSVLSKSTDMPCIYLIRIGFINDIFRTDYCDEKNHVIMKVGLTKSLSRRMYEHDRNYKNEFGVSPTLEYYSYIDPQYVSKVETDIKTYVTESNMLLPYERYEHAIELSDAKNAIELLAKDLEIIINNYYDVIINNDRVIFLLYMATSNVTT
jgi:hypothetical protein